MNRRLDKIVWIVVPTYNKDQPYQTILPGGQVTGIIEHIPSDPGMLWHYDIHFEDGSVVRHFDVLSVGTDPDCRLSEQTKEGGKDG